MALGAGGPPGGRRARIVDDASRRGNRKDRCSRSARRQRGRRRSAESASSRVCHQTLPPRSPEPSQEPRWLRPLRFERLHFEPLAVARCVPSSRAACDVGERFFSPAAAQELGSSAATARAGRALVAPLTRAQAELPLARAAAAEAPTRDPRGADVVALGSRHEPTRAPGAARAADLLGARARAPVTGPSRARRARSTARAGPEVAPRTPGALGGAAPRARLTPEVAVAARALFGLHLARRALRTARDAARAERAPVAPRAARAAAPGALAHPASTRAAALGLPLDRAGHADASAGARAGVGPRAVLAELLLGPAHSAAHVTRWAAGGAVAGLRGRARRPKSGHAALRARATSAHTLARTVGADRGISVVAVQLRDHSVVVEIDARRQASAVDALGTRRTRRRTFPRRSRAIALGGHRAVATPHRVGDLRAARARAEHEQDEDSKGLLGSKSHAERRSERTKQRACLPNRA